MAQRRILSYSEHIIELRSAYRQVDKRYKQSKIWFEIKIMQG